MPIDWGATTTGLADMVADNARQRIYIANPGLNRIEVFDMQRRQFLTPIEVGTIAALDGLRQRRQHAVRRERRRRTDQHQSI